MGKNEENMAKAEPRTPKQKSRKGLEEKYPWQKLMLTEYGADANLDHQTEYLGDALNWGKSFYPETFQTKTHEYQWSVIAKHPYIVASYLWNTFDFATPLANRGDLPARNMKGMVTFDRKTLISGTRRTGVKILSCT